MITKSLADISNMNKDPKDKTTTTAHSKAEGLFASQIADERHSLSAIDYERQRQANTTAVGGILPLADSFIDGFNETSRRENLNNDVTLGKDNNNSLFNLNDPNKTTALSTAGDLDDFDQYGGPGSIFNTNANLEDMLLDVYPDQINIELTPGREHKSNKGKGGSDDDDDDEDEDEDNLVSPGSKNVSPKQKRHYRKSNNNKENLLSQTDLDATDAADGDGTLNNDPTKNLNKRAKTMVSLLNKGFAKHPNVGFFEVIRKNNKKQSAQKFYSLLVLKKYDIIDVSQAKCFDDIIISKGEMFDTFAL
jgi:hypothetical protein